MRKLPAAPALLAAAALWVAPSAFAQEADKPAEQAEQTETDASDATEAEAAPAAAAQDGKKTAGEDGEESADAAALGNPAMAAAANSGRPFPLYLQTSVTNTLGSGTFVGGYANNAMFATNLNVSPYIMWKGWLAFASQSFDMEWTPSDFTTYPQQLIWSDTQLAARYMNLRIPEAGLSFQVGGGATLPVSLGSQWMGRLTTLSTNGRVLWSLPAGFTAQAGTNASYNVLVPGLANRAIDINRLLGGNPPVNCLLRSAEEANNYGCGGGFFGTPRAGGYGANASLMWMGFEGQLMLSGRASFMHNVSAFIGPEDEFTPFQPGTQRGLQWNIPSTAGSLSAAYTPTSWFTLSVGTSTWQPLFTRAGVVRPFPFWDVAVNTNPKTTQPMSTPANNFSSVWLSTTFTL